MPFPVDVSRSIVPRLFSLPSLSRVRAFLSTTMVLLRQCNRKAAGIEQQDRTIASTVRTVNDSSPSPTAETTKPSPLPSPLTARVQNRDSMHATRFAKPAGRANEICLSKHKPARASSREKERERERERERSSARIARLDAGSCSETEFSFSRAPFQKHSRPIGVGTRGVIRSSFRGALTSKPWHLNTTDEHDAKRETG